MNREQCRTKKEQIILLTKNIFYNSKHNFWHYFILPFHEPSFVSLKVVASKRQMSDSESWHF